MTDFAIILMSQSSILLNTPFELNRDNVSNWGSCSSKGNINLNLRLVTLPAELHDYVMLCELCHLKQMNHGPEFHALLELVCPGHRELQRRMKAYRFG